MAESQENVKDGPLDQDKVRMQITSALRSLFVQEGRITVTKETAVRITSEVMDRIERHERSKASPVWLGTN